MDINRDEPNFPQILFAEGVAPNETSEELVERIIDAVKKVYDPEIPVDIYELGLIYAIEFLDLTENNIRIRVDMTLTAPGCPVAGEMPSWVSNAVYSIPEIKECMVDLVWEPFWTPQRMSLRAKLELNML
ncbi:iron-sulfur cluster assembly protein [Ignatzschineria sp. LJL83]